MASVVRMPSVLAGASEAAIASWLVAPGDSVAVGQPLAEIETEKALVEYAAEEAGVVGRLVLAVGDTGEIGEPIAVLVADGETDADIDAALGTETPAPRRRSRQPHRQGVRNDVRNGRNVVDGPSSTKECGRWDIDYQRAAVAGRGGRIADLRQPACAEDRRRAGHRPRGDRGHGPEWADRPARPGAVPGGPAPSAWSPNRFKRQRQRKHQPRSWPVTGSSPTRRCGAPSLVGSPSPRRRRRTST